MNTNGNQGGSSGLPTHPIHSLRSTIKQAHVAHHQNVQDAQEWARINQKQQSLNQKGMIKPDNTHDDTRGMNEAFDKFTRGMHFKNAAGATWKAIKWMLGR